MKQRFTSRATSINKDKLPAVYKKLGTKILKDAKIIDVGGGKFDNAVNWAKEACNASVTVYDPYNRTEEENRKALAGSYQFAICSNVLNVIDSRDARIETLKTCSSHAAITFITVYEGNGTGIGRKTGEDQWQENRKLASYEDECREVFHTVNRKRGMLICF